MDFPARSNPVLYPPLDVSKIKDEKGVKRLIKRLLDQYGWFHWMPAANGYGTSGVSDHLAIKDGVLLAIEAKFDRNKPKPLQQAFAAQIIANQGFAFCVNEKNIDHLAWWLESFDHSVLRERRGEPVEEAHGARMVNAMVALMELFR